MRLLYEHDGGADGDAEVCFWPWPGPWTIPPKFLSVRLLCEHDSGGGGDGDAEVRVSAYAGPNPD